jgi:hypothetical protein
MERSLEGKVVVVAGGTRGAHLREHFQNVPGSQIAGLSHLPDYEGFFTR